MPFLHLTGPLVDPAHHLGGGRIERRPLEARYPQEALRQLVLLGEVEQRPATNVSRKHGKTPL